ncbi:DUF1871 family protein [Listeria goaensis]|uniref:DUF1871 family protein n=1 Tax=Listeria goaensis TaxID=1649188 RepID=UPI000B589D42|nr:DUF1871 family protein [Listeria goaensis]
MEETVTNIINNWNPIEIYPLLYDEYQDEVGRIVTSLSKSKSIDSVAAVIYSVFLDSFGSLFEKTEEECRNIAEKIVLL